MQYHVTCKSHAVFYAVSVTQSNNIITAQHSLEFACNLDDSLHNSGLLLLKHSAFSTTFTIFTSKVENMGKNG